MDGRFRSLSLMETPEPMDLDSPLQRSSRDPDGDVIMDESISNSPSLPLRYHNYFHRIKMVNQTRHRQEVDSLEDMRSRIQEIDNSLKVLSAHQEKMKASSNTSVSPNLADKIIDPIKTHIEGKTESEQHQQRDVDNNNNNKSLIKSMMSPTLLGARMAYNSSPASSPLKKPIEEDENEIVEYSTSEGVVEDKENGAVVATGTPRPLVQFQLHHHHYYYPVNQGLDQALTQVLTQNKDTHQDANLQLQRLTSDGEVFLPKPTNFQDTPYYISTYLQTLLNFVVTSYGCYIVYQLISGMKSDIDLRLKEKIQDLLIEVEFCRDNFEENKCFKDTITPVIREQCAEWEKCMYKDPFSTSGKLVITLQLIGMIVDSLIEPISLRSCFVLVVVVCCSFALNFSFGFLRLKIYYRERDVS